MGSGQAASVINNPNHNVLSKKICHIILLDMSLTWDFVSELDRLRSILAHFWGFILTSSHVSWTGYGSCGKPVLTTSASSAKSVRSFKNLFWHWKMRAFFWCSFVLPWKKAWLNLLCQRERGGFKSCGFVFGLAACTHTRGINFQFSSIISSH